LNYPGSPEDWKEEVKFIIFDLNKIEGDETSLESAKEEVLNSLLKILQNPELDEQKKNLKDV